MKMFEVLPKIFEVRKYLLLLFLISNILTLTFAENGINNIQKAMGTFCSTARSLIVVVAIVLAVLSALVYAIGQILGAETRARATVWATAMFTGAIIGIIIFLVVPVIIGILLGKGSDVDWVTECCRPEPTEACTNLGGSS